MNSDALQTAWLFDIDVLIGPAQQVGTGPAGERTDYPIIGGSFAGPELSGVVLAGGAEGFAPYVHRKQHRPAPNTPLLDNQAWTAFHFWRDGALIEIEADVVMPRAGA